MDTFKVRATKKNTPEGERGIMDCDFLYWEIARARERLVRLELDVSVIMGKFEGSKQPRKERPGTAPFIIIGFILGSFLTASILGLIFLKP